MGQAKAGVFSQKVGEATLAIDLAAQTDPGLNGRFSTVPGRHACF